jgi:hypothetical protein
MRTTPSETTILRSFDEATKKILLSFQIHDDIFFSIFI